MQKEGFEKARKGARLGAKAQKEGAEMYDVLIVGAGPGGIFTAYELLEKRPDLSIAVFEMGNELEKRHCPIDGDKIKSCIRCKHCSIMSGFGGAGAFSDGKYNITMISAARCTNTSGKRLPLSSWST